MSSDSQAAQICLLRHLRTEIPPSKAKRKQSILNNVRNKHSFNEENHHQTPYKQNKFNKKTFNPRQILQSEDWCHKCGDSKHIEGLQCSARKYQCRNPHVLSF